MGRTIGWFSCGAASAVACCLSQPDVIAYRDTGAEHKDNARFMRDCERMLFKRKVLVLKSTEYKDTWDVWEKKRYIAGIKGAPCTGKLKVDPRIAFSKPDDVHLWGYTYDSTDVARADRMEDMWPDLDCRFPLIEKKLTKSNCLALLQSAGIREPVTYAMGFPNANCLPCPKATSPDYWALVRSKAPEQFQRMVELSRKLKVRLTRIKGKRSFIDEIPTDWPTTQPIVPSCDLFCQATNLKDEADTAEDEL